MNWQLDEMRSSGKDTSNQAGWIIKNMNWLAKEMHFSVQESQAAMQRSTRQSQASLDASINQFHLDQRAWVGLLSVNGLNFRDEGDNPVYIKDGQMTRLGADLTNSGKTIAKQVKSCVNTAFVPRGNTFIPQDKDCSATFLSSPVVLPGMKITVWTSDSEMLRGNAGLINVIRSGNVQLYFFGRVEYYDVFGARHFYRFCAALSKDMSSFVSAGPYNDAN